MQKRPFGSLNLLNFALAAGLALGSVMPVSAQSCSFEATPSGPPKAQALALDAAKLNPCTTVPGLTVKSLANVFASLLSTPKVGGKRFETTPPDGLPEGKMMVSAQGIEFKLQLLAPEGVTGLQVRSAGVLVFSAANPAAGPLLIAPTKFKPGETYDWSISTRKANFKASFELLDLQDMADVQSKLKALQSANLAPNMRLLYAAAIFEDADLYFDRDQVLGELRRQIAP